jgi:hypothetical protein
MRLWTLVCSSRCTIHTCMYVLTRERRKVDELRESVNTVGARALYSS